MFVTREADYAVRCVLFLSREADRTVSANEIANSMAVPKSFLSKILQRLSKKGIVQSSQGMAGGFRLARLPDQVNLLEVLEAIQGPSMVNACASDRHQCGFSSYCVVHPIWVELREGIEQRLKKETFAELIKKGKRVLRVRQDSLY